MTSALRTAIVTLLTLATAAPALAQPKDKPLPEPMPMGVPRMPPPALKYWHVPATPPGTYYTVYPATRPVIIVTPRGPVATTVPTGPVVVGPTWALSPVAPHP